MEQVYSFISQEITRMNCTQKQTQNIAYYAGLEEAQAGIKIAGRNINNLRYADDTTLMTESEQELKSLLMKVKVESGKVGLKLNIQKLRSWHLVPSVQFSSVQSLSHVRLFATS